MGTDYNLEVLTRKGYKDGKYDARGMRYVEIDKCMCYNCDNDGMLIWFYEDDCYKGCANTDNDWEPNKDMCDNHIICKSCVITVTDQDFRQTFGVSEVMEERQAKDEDWEICADCFHLVWEKTKNNSRTEPTLVERILEARKNK